MTDIRAILAASPSPNSTKNTGSKTTLGMGYSTCSAGDTAASRRGDLPRAKPAGTASTDAMPSDASTLYRLTANAGARSGTYSRNTATVAPGVGSTGLEITTAARCHSPSSTAIETKYAPACARALQNVFFLIGLSTCSLAPLPASPRPKTHAVDEKPCMHRTTRRHRSQSRAGSAAGPW